jgi:hypothetical protein
LAERTIKCLLFPVHATKTHLVPVPVEELSDPSNPVTPLDLEVERYLHKKDTKRFVRLVDETITVHEFPPGSKHAPRFKFLIFYSLRVSLFLN